MSQEVKQGKEIVLDVKSAILGSDIEIGVEDEFSDILRAIELELTTEENTNGIQLNKRGNG